MSPVTTGFLDFSFYSTLHSSTTLILFKHHFTKSHPWSRMHSGLPLLIASSLNCFVCLHLALYPNFSTHSHLFPLPSQFPPPSVFCKHLMLSLNCTAFLRLFILCSIKTYLTVGSFMAIHPCQFYALSMLEPECWSNKSDFTWAGWN